MQLQQKPKKLICTKECENYNSGGFGERSCNVGKWDERSKSNKPQIDNDYSVICPQYCRFHPANKNRYKRF